VNQLLDVRKPLVEVLKVGPRLLVFLILLIFLILLHNTSFDNLKLLAAPGHLLQLVLQVREPFADLVQDIVQLAIVGVGLVEVCFVFLSLVQSDYAGVSRDEVHVSVRSQLHLGGLVGRVGDPLLVLLTPLAPVWGAVVCGWDLLIVQLQPGGETVVTAQPGRLAVPAGA